MAPQYSPHYADLDALERFAERQEISGWLRGAAFKAMVALVLWGRVPRDDALTRFAWLFRRKPFSREDDITWTQLADHVRAASGRVNG